MSNVFLKDLTLEQFMKDVDEVIKLKGWHGLAIVHDGQGTALGTISGQEHILVELFDDLETRMLELMSDDSKSTLDKVSQDIEEVFTDKGLDENKVDDENVDEENVDEENAYEENVGNGNSITLDDVLDNIENLLAIVLHEVSQH